MKKKFEDGTYIGKLNILGQRHGFGKFITDDGSIYEGMWKNDKMFGEAKLSFDDGLTIEGFFDEKNEVIKNATSKFVNNIIVKCDYDLNNGMTGPAIINLPNGSIAEGNYKNNEPVGIFKITENDRILTGPVNKYLLIQGKGQIIWKKDSAVYLGDINNNYCEGYGTIKWEDGFKVEGHFKENKMDGFMTIYDLDGHIIKGNYEKGQPVGIFTILTEDQEIIGPIASIKECNINGNGKIVYKNAGIIYEGNIIDNKPSGYGTITDQNNTKFEGNWKIDNQDGDCILLNSENSIKFVIKKNSNQ